MGPLPLPTACGFAADRKSFCETDVVACEPGAAERGTARHRSPEAVFDGQLGFDGEMGEVVVEEAARVKLEPLLRAVGANHGQRMARVGQLGELNLHDRYRTKSVAACRRPMHDRPAFDDGSSARCPVVLGNPPVIRTQLVDALTGWMPHSGAPFAVTGHG